MSVLSKAGQVATLLLCMTSTVSVNDRYKKYLDMDIKMNANFLSLCNKLWNWLRIQQLGNGLARFNNAPDDLL